MLLSTTQVKRHLIYYELTHGLKSAALGSITEGDGMAEECTRGCERPCARLDCIP